MASKTELAWAAGFFDGEGCVTAFHEKGRANPKHRLCLFVAQAGTVEHLERFQKIVGVGNIAGPYYRDGKQPYYQWRTSGKKAHLVMGLLAPYLCSVKTARYDALVLEGVA